jgi:hypothetical protein
MTLWITAYVLLAFCTWNAMPWPDIFCTKTEAAKQIAVQLFWSATWPVLLTTALIKKIIS